MKGASARKKGPSDSWLTPTFSLQLTWYFLAKKEENFTQDKSQFRPCSIDTDVPLQLRFKASSLIYNLGWLYFY